MFKDISLKPEGLSDIVVLQELRKDPNCKVLVSAEELSCLIYQAQDTDAALNDVVSRLSFIQDTFNMQKSDRPIGFPELVEVWGHSYADIAHKWIDNLLVLAAKPKQHSYASDGIAEWSDSFKCTMCGKQQTFAAEDNMSVKRLNTEDTTPCEAKGG
jgi:hypothetical protein